MGRVRVWLDLLAPLITPRLHGRGSVRHAPFICSLASSLSFGSPPVQLNRPKKLEERNCGNMLTAHKGHDIGLLYIALFICATDPLLLGKEIPCFDFEVQLRPYMICKMANSSSLAMDQFMFHIYLSLFI